MAYLVKINRKVEKRPLAVSYKKGMLSTGLLEMTETPGCEGRAS